ncbi:hypothetical protein [Streptomyces canus]|uniref:hypothetical protein n=1 Tax=Streptomyces canus TaxID=58343 RepID=UPI002258EC47|nr:hypothetical protein [Streptomyces canus]MCX4857543.1 hypothetical protein [Streptomyces canus]
MHKSRVKATYAHRWTSPAQARRRARRWTAFAGALVVSPFAVLAVAATGLIPAEAAIAAALVAGPAGMLLFTEVNAEKRPQHRSGTLLTARTLAGERTVDLSRIERVRLLTYFSRSGVSERVLLVRDAWGTSLGLTSPASRRALRRALERPPGRGPRPRVSRAALVHLGMLPAPGRLALHTAAVWLATVLGICGYMVAVLALAD